MSGVTNPALSQVRNALNKMNKLEKYIDTGMTSADMVAQDLLENKQQSEDVTERLQHVKDVMLDFVRMERDFKQFCTSVETALEKDAQSDKLEELLDSELAIVQQGNNEEKLKEHRSYTELLDKIYDRGVAGTQSASQSAPLSESEDFVMTEATISTKCPITGKEMVQPVKNVHCGHHYEKDGMLAHVKSLKQKARCPISGCLNQLVLKASDCVDSREMINIIADKNRQAGTRTQPSGIMESQEY